MISLKDYLISEMKDTYRRAAEKAMKLGDPRADKFLQAYNDALKKEAESDKDERKSNLYKYYQEDKAFMRKLNKLAKKSNQDIHDGKIYLKWPGYIDKYYDKENPYKFNICVIYVNPTFDKAGTLIKDATFYPQCFRKDTVGHDFDTEYMEDEEIAAMPNTRSLLINVYSDKNNGKYADPKYKGRYNYFWYDIDNNKFIKTITDIDDDLQKAFDELSEYLK